MTTDGEFRVVRQMPADGVAKAGPCFFVASREPGMAGLAEFEIGVQVPGVDRLADGARTDGADHGRPDAGRPGPDRRCPS